jgi:hypothetical protein
MPATSEVLSDSEVHVYINNIPPRLRGGYPMVQTTRNTTPNLSLSAPGPSHPVHISNQPSHAVPLTVPVCSGHPLARNITRVLILHDCATKRRFPTVEELLQLMDTCRPAVGMKYLDKLDAFQDMDLSDIVDVYSLPVELLATIGDTGRTAAKRLHEYCKDELLDPLRFLLSDSSDGSTANNSEVPALTLRELGLRREDSRRRILRWAENVRTCEEGREAKLEVVDEEKTETIVVMDEDDDDVATFRSCKV